MTVWRPGMRCVCIDDTPPWYAHGGLDGLRKGSIYTVRAVGRPGPENPDQSLGLFLVEIVRPLRLDDTAEVPFAVRRFRPLCETRLDQFRKHLNRILSDGVPA